MCVEYLWNVGFIEPVIKARKGVTVEIITLN